MRERDRETERQRQREREREVLERRGMCHLCTTLSVTTADGSNKMYNIYVHVLHVLYSSTRYISIIIYMKLYIILLLMS